MSCKFKWNCQKLWNHECSSKCMLTCASVTLKQSAFVIRYVVEWCVSNCAVHNSCLPQSSFLWLLGPSLWYTIMTAQICRLHSLRFLCWGEGVGEHKRYSVWASLERWCICFVAVLILQSMSGTFLTSLFKPHSWFRDILGCVEADYGH
jgi:hypothetical protein